MKYKIICSCGHEIIIDVYGETLKHEKKLLFYRENECPDCLIRSLEKQEFMKSLPSLVGSNKQIRWALQLREKHIDLLKRSYEESCCNDELLWLIFFVAKLTDASSFINAEMSDSSILGFYSNLYRSKNIN